MSPNGNETGDDVKLTSPVERRWTNGGGVLIDRLSTVDAGDS